MSESSDELYGMGTTAVAVIADGDAAYIAHVGDSRAYIIRNNSITHLTRDHSVVAQMIERGEITRDEAKSHPDRHIITRAVGVNDKINVDFLNFEITEGDILVVCTDGLSGFVTEEDMLSLTADGQYHKFADRLVSLANKNGGADNITVVAFVK
jgi:protein phosphatase